MRLDPDASLSIIGGWGDDPHDGGGEALRVLSEVAVRISE